MNIFTLMGTILVDNVAANKSISDTGNAAEGMGNKFSKAGVAIAGVATSIGAAVIGMCNKATDAAEEYNQAFNSLKAKTGAAGEELNELDSIMKSIYSNNYGENFEDISECIGEVKKQTGLAGDALEEFTTDAIILRDTFDYEVSESTKAANMLMKQFGITGEEAFNLIAQGAQSGLDQNQNLLDSINEYSVHFKQMGLDADEMFNMFANGAAQGVFDVDKLGDSIKEFGIRAKVIDDSGEAFEKLGFNAEEMVNKFNAGGEIAKQAFQEVNSALANMNDATEQNTIGVELYGTMWEDIGKDAVVALSDLNGTFDETLNTMAEIDSIKYDNFSAGISGIGRQLETNVLLPLGEKLLPYLNEFATWISQNENEIIESVSGVFDSIAEGVEFLVEHLEEITTAAGAAFTGIMAFKAVNEVTSIVNDASIAFDGLQIAFSFLLTNPIALTITGIAVAIGLIASAAADARERQEAINEELQRTIELQNDMTGATDDVLTGLEEEESALEATFMQYEEMSEKIESLTKVRDELNEKVRQGIPLTEEENELLYQSQNQISQTSDKINSLNAKLVNQYGSLENAKDRLEAYNERIKNAKDANDLLNRYVDADAKALANQALKLQTNANNAEDLYKKYKTLADDTNRTSAETQEMESCVESLRQTLGNNILMLDAETNTWAINEEAVLSSIEATRIAANAKIDSANSMNVASQSRMITSKQEAQAIITSTKAEIAAYEALMATGDEVYNAADMDAMNDRIAAAEMYLNNVSTAVTNVGKSASSASKTAGTTAKKESKDALEAWKEAYDKKKKLGDIDAKTQYEMLVNMKKQYSDTATHIVEANEFALGEIKGIIEERKATEQLTTDEVIALYEKSKSTFCTTYEDKKEMTDAINEEIRSSTDMLVENIDELNEKDLSNLIDKLSDMKDKYSDHKYDVSYIEEQITAACQKEYEKQYESLSDNIDKMKEKRKSLYDAEVDNIDEELENTLNGLQEELDKIEEAANERSRIEREERLKEALAKAETVDEIKKAQDELDKYLLEQTEKENKKRIQALMESAKEEAKQKKENAKNSYEKELEELDNFMAEETRKMDLRKTNRSITEEELTKLAKEQLEQQEKDLQESLDAREASFLRYVEAIGALGNSVGDIIIGESKPDGSHRAGLNYVPFDNYIASLHEGERILTKEENEEYSNIQQMLQNNMQDRHVSVDLSELTEYLGLILKSIDTLPKRQKIEQNMA